MYSFRKFCTGSRYDGSFMENLQCMNGVGRYFYPDGSEYHGSFKNGKFHGYGRVKLKHPYNVAYKGVFENGKLIEIEDVRFGDGLRVDIKWNDDQIKFDDWHYCTKYDRRYSTELCWDIEAVGPHSHITRLYPTRELKPDRYDTEEGIFNKDTGFLNHRPAPFATNTFIGCEAEAEWIKMYCRRGKVIDEEDVTNENWQSKLKKLDKAVCSQIFEANVMGMQHLQKVKTCSCNAKDDTMFTCNELEQETSDELQLLPTDTSSASSFSDNTLIVNVKKNVRLAVQDIDRLSTAPHEDVNKDLLVNKKAVYFL